MSKNNETSVTNDATKKGLAERLKEMRVARAIAHIRKHLRVKPGFPKEDILFCDLCGELCQPGGPKAISTAMLSLLSQFEYDAIMVPESRGFIVGMLAAAKVKKPAILARKPGKLPFETYEASHGIEYSEVTLQAQILDFVPILKKCQKEGRKPVILIIDDLKATGGTMIIMRELVTMAGCEVAGYAVLTDLADIPLPVELQDKPFVSALQLTNEELREIAVRTERKYQKLKEQGLVA